MHQIEKKALNPGADSGGCAPGTLRPPPPHTLIPGAAISIIKGFQYTSVVPVNISHTDLFQSIYKRTLCM